MRALKNLQNDIAFVVERMQEAFSHLTFQQEGHETLGYESNERKIRIFTINNPLRIDSKSLVVRKYGFEPQDTKILDILEELESREVLKRNYVGYEPGIQIASRFEIQYN